MPEVAANKKNMKEQKQLTVKMNKDLYEAAMRKCDEQLSISLSALIKVFLSSFVSQRGVGFYVGDEDLCALFAKWVRKQKLRKSIQNKYSYVGPYLKDLYDL